MIQPEVKTNSRQKALILAAESRNARLEAEAETTQPASGKLLEHDLATGQKIFETLSGGRIAAYTNTNAALPRGTQKTLLTTANSSQAAFDHPPHTPPPKAEPPFPTLIQVKRAPDPNEPEEEIEPLTPESSQGIFFDAETGVLYIWDAIEGVWLGQATELNIYIEAAEAGKAYPIIPLNTIPSRVLELKLLRGSATLSKAVGAILNVDETLELTPGTPPQGEEDLAVTVSLQAILPEVP